MIETTIPPALSEGSNKMIVERVMPIEAKVLYKGWTEQFDRWFAAPGSVLMSPTIDAPFYFQTDFGGRRSAHYGRFLRLEPHRVIELSWVTGAGGTEGAETVVTVELMTAGEGTRVRLSHEGFPHERVRNAHEQAWPMVLAQLERGLSSPT